MRKPDIQDVPVVYDKLGSLTGVIHTSIKLLSFVGVLIGLVLSYYSTFTFNLKALVITSIFTLVNVLVNLRV